MGRPITTRATSRTTRRGRNCLLTSPPRLARTSSMPAWRCERCLRRHLRVGRLRTPLRARSARFQAAVWLLSALALPVVLRPARALVEPVIHFRLQDRQEIRNFVVVPIGRVFLGVVGEEPEAGFD